MTNPFVEIVSELLANCSSATMNVELVDINGCDWNVDSALGHTHIEMPFNSDTYDVADMIRAACNETHLSVDITNTEDGRIETLITR